MKSIALALEKLNVAPKTIASVTADAEKLDARSLPKALWIHGLWRNVIDESALNQHPSIQRLHHKTQWQKPLDHLGIGARVL